MMKSDNALDLFALKAIFEHLDDAIITHDLNQTILNCNPAAEEIFGWNSEDILGQPIHKLIPEDLYDEQNELFQRLLAGEKIVHFRTYRLTSNQQIFPVAITISPVKNELGIIIGASHIIRNASSEKNAEEKQGVLAAIIDDSEDAIISKTLEGYITSWNSGAEQIFGYHPKEVIGKHISILIPPDRIGEEDRILSNIRQGNKIEHFETFRLSKAGALIPISLTVSPVKDKQGQIIGISKIARNIQHKKLAEEKQAVLAAIVENSDDAIISKTLQGIITSWNKGAERIFGHHEKDVLGKHISIIIPPDRMDEEANIISNIKIGVTVHHFQTVRLTKFGKPVDISLTVSPIRDVNGTITGASKIARDISNERAAQAAIKELSKKKDEFIAMASHELKTPLTSMSGYLQLLAKRVTEPNKAFVEKVLLQLGKLNALINDLFDISKIQAGKLQFSFEEVNMELLISDIIEPLKEANPQYHFQIQPECGITIEGDKMRLEQVMSNLVANAIKYSPEGGTIELGVENRNDHILVCVKDQGIGIDAESLQHIFSQFYRAQTVDKAISGLGLGLYITKEIIERHGGSIWVESEVGKGSLFTFSLPIKQNYR
jgi:PAS domain S-box-containing protein